MEHYFLAPLKTELAGPAVTDAQGQPVQVDLAGLHAAIQQLTTLLAQLTTTVNGKASQSSLSALSQRVTTLSTTVDGKASTAYVDQQVHAIGDVDAGQAAAIAQLKQSLAGDEGTLQTLLATQASQGLLLTGLRTDVDAKAPGATVSTLSGQLTTLRNAVNDTTTGLVATKAVADGAASSAATANAEAAKRVLRTGDTMTGALNVPQPASGANALRLDNVPSGGNRPLREFIGATTTAAAGKDPGTGATALTDPLALGRAASLRYFGLVWKELPLTSAITTVALKDQAGTVVLTKTFPVGTVYALGNLLDLLDLTATKFPEVPSGSTLYLTTSQGKANANADFAFITPNSL